MSLELKDSQPTILIKNMPGYHQPGAAYREYSKEQRIKVQTPQGLFFHQRMNWHWDQPPKHSLSCYFCLHPSLPILLKVPQTHLPTRHSGLFCLTTSDS